jgi:RNA polymerase sigma-70 factor (ECF subfamily)
MKIIEKPELFDSNKKFSSWIYTVAYNMCKNEYRTNITKGNNINFDINLLKELPTFNAFVNKYDVDFFINSLNTELNNLSEKHKQTFDLRHKEMLSIKEISVIMDCSEGTVKSRLFYAIKELSHKLQLFNIDKEVYYEN